MKLRINKEQVLELTIYQKYKLRNWWTPEKYDVVYDSFYEKEGVITTMVDELLGETYRINSLPLLNIGQMVMLLHNYGYNTEFLRWQDMDCDNLFELVKIVLGEEDDEI